MSTGNSLWKPSVFVSGLECVTLLVTSTEVSQFTVDPDQGAIDILVELY